MIVKILAAIVVFLGLGLLFSRLFLPAIIFLGAGFYAWTSGNWWPLLAAFILGWVLRLMGMDPGWKK